MTVNSAPRLEPHELAELGPPEAVRLPLDHLDMSPSNPRQQLLEIDLLADSIAEFGLLHPIVVRRIGERYEVLGGHRRLAAFKLLRERAPHDVVWRTIPSVVRTEADEDRALRMLITSQVHSRGWRPKEEASMLERLVLAGRTLQQVGAALHRTEGWASKRLRVYADATLSAYVQTGRLSTGVAEELLVIKDAPTRKDFAERAVSEAWSQDKARGEVRLLRADKVVREIGRRSRELLEALSVIDPTKLPAASTRDLWALHGRIEQLATGKAPVFPSLEAARAAAHVSETPRRQRQATRPKQRTMPKPA